MVDPPTVPSPQNTKYLAPIGLTLVAAASLMPLYVEARPVVWILPYATDFERNAAKAIAVLLLVLPLAVRDFFDREREPLAVSLTSGFLALAALMTAFHAYHVDRLNGDWQPTLYMDILNQTPDENGLRIPHQFRPLPYGFVRMLEWITADWWFSCVIYRWCLTFWFLWGAHRFARLFLKPMPALLTILPLAALYPISVWEYAYRGQLTDPLSHSLFLFALIYVVQDRWILLTFTLALGVLAKETVLLVAVSYFACYWRQGMPAIYRTVVLGSACVAAYFAVRAPIGWRLGFDKINGTEGLMIGTNLGFGEPIANLTVPLWINYCHLLVFVLPFLPFIVFRWKRLDHRLKAVFLTLTPLIFVTNICFGWMYESRNYMPLVPLHATMAAMAVFSRRDSTEASLPATGQICN
jgi:hypothetical protein